MSDILSSSLPPADPLLAQGGLALPNWGMLRFQGDDAAAFLHGQLTQDVLLLGNDMARLVGYCSPKGRLLATGIAWKQGNGDILWACQRDLIPALSKRLTLFVMRAKVKISDASADFQLYGVLGNSIPNTLANAPWSKVNTDEQTWIRLWPGAGLPRALLCVPTSSTLPHFSKLSPEYWQWLEVQSGVAMLNSQLADALVPQMLNYESVGGVNFKKGCYPGQEVVARSQYRGILKRRTHLFHTTHALAVGEEIFHEDDPSQACGLVVAAAPHPHGGWDALVALQTQALERGRISVTSAQADAPSLQALPLPYPLLQDL